MIPAKRIWDMFQATLAHRTDYIYSTSIPDPELYEQIAMWCRIKAAQSSVRCDVIGDMDVVCAPHWLSRTSGITSPVVDFYTCVETNYRAARFFRKSPNGNGYRITGLLRLDQEDFSANKVFAGLYEFKEMLGIVKAAR